MINILKEIEIILRTHGTESKTLISLKTVASLPIVLSLDNDDTITNPSDIANTCNITLPLQLKLRKEKHKIFT